MPNTELAPLVDRQSNVPTRKVGIGIGAVGAVVTIIVWTLAEYGGKVLPGEIQAALHTLISLGVAYFVRDRENV